MNIYEQKSQAEAILENADKAGVNPGAILSSLKSLDIETPSWGYANTGTRFGKFLQAGAASTIEEKLADAAMVHKVTGICQSVAVHVLWDFPNGVDSGIVNLAEKLGVKIGAINPNIFQDQCYKYGSLANPDKSVRDRAISHVVKSIELAKDLKSSILSIWLADGTNYPGQDDMAERRIRLIDSLKQIHDNLFDGLTMVIEYKPFEPPAYQTDIADWGMSLLLARHAGKQAKVLVDIGHHYMTQNVEQIVTWLIEENMLGGFHFNDRKYADDDLTTGSIDPYQMFRIFNEIVSAQQVRNRKTQIAYMVDQSHNLKPKIEAMIQTVDTIHQLYAKALLVDRKSLKDAQSKCDIVSAEEILRSAYLIDTRPLVGYIRSQMNRNPDALTAYRESGYQKKIETQRAGNMDQESSFA